MTVRLLKQNHSSRPFWRVGWRLSRDRGRGCRSGALYGRPSANTREPSLRRAGHLRTARSNLPNWLQRLIAVGELEDPLRQKPIGGFGQCRRLRCLRQRSTCLNSACLLRLALLLRWSTRLDGSGSVVELYYASPSGLKSYVLRLTCCLKALGGTPRMRLNAAENWSAPW